MCGHSSSYFQGFEASTSLIRLSPSGIVTAVRRTFCDAARDDLVQSDAKIGDTTSSTESTRAVDHQEGQPTL